MIFYNQCSLALENGVFPAPTSGCTNPENGNRFRFVYAMNNEVFKSFMAGNTSIVDKTTINSTKNFYAFYIYKNGKKYIHIEKDGTVSFTNKPTFYVESILVDDSDAEQFLNFHMQAYYSRYNDELHKELFNAIEIKKNWKNKDYLKEGQTVQKSGSENNSTTNNASNKQGCYVATCVYGSYDCPEVWVLRRYRDYKLSKSWFGRIFIKTYYFISPKMVKLFGNKKWFRSIFKKPIEKMVKKYKQLGYEDTPYQDRNW